MMSAQDDWRRPLRIRRSAQRLQPLAWPLDGQRPFIPRAARPDGDLACLPSGGNDVLALHRSSLCRANLARGLRVHFAGRVTLDGRAARLPFRFGPRRASLRNCQMCAVGGDRVRSSVKISMIAIRVPRPFLLAHPRRPRLGMSDRRASSLKRRLALTPATAGYDFLPLVAARPFLAQARKSCPGCPLLRAGPFGVRVDRLRSVASHRGRDGRGPGN